ncbi:hypothetical protein SAMD00023353_0700560 [Rosellinia necatrix]|uniref:Uncharacterized protein n=1 Tax=Rosellinia necatrix TaxID=77044 RepID=A0A1S7ULP1_ROSNE|nr:hypothetical protein SAMD00023353_0700560 [Rosellinia necatrix]
MTSHFESAFGITTSTRDSSPTEILGDSKIRRALVKIPSAQKELLSRSESWASFLSRRPKGFVNVPPHVLDQLKALHARRRHEPGLPKAPGPSSHAEADTNAPGPSGSQSSISPRVEQDDGEGERNDADDPEEPIPWSPSPEPQPKPQAAESEESSQSFLSQLPEESPPRPTLATSPPNRSKLPEFSRSSQGSEDELEVEVPAALGYNPEPINKAALPVMTTPPSAQIVPCTLEQPTQGASTKVLTKSSLQTIREPKKHRYNRVPELYRAPKQVASSSHLQTNVSYEKAVPVSDENFSAVSSVPTGNTSSSVIPSTRDDESIERPGQTGAGNAISGQMQVHNADFTLGNHHLSLVSRPWSPAQHSTSLSHMMHSLPPPIPASHDLIPSDISSRSWEAPFVHYTVTYPSYNGTLQDFMAACIYIQLQYRRIRTSLYDDFIRAWVEGYLPYVKDCDEAHPPRKALRAIEWYNEIDDDPLYTSRVVTRQNLESVLNFYPNELVLARLSLGIFSSQRTSENLRSHNHAELNARRDQSPSHLPPERRKSEVIQAPQNSAKRVAGASKSPAIPIPELPPLIFDQRAQSHSSHGGLETRFAQHEIPKRSVSESTMHKKRTAASELHSEGTKRTSLSTASGIPTWTRTDPSDIASSVPEVSNGSARNPPAPRFISKAKPTKSVDDPDERRRRRLAKHIKRRMAERDGIASSAPISNTPTSGQGH